MPLILGEPDMIKLMRESAHKYPWILKSMMGILAIAFVITMGWWGFSEQQSDAVASVGELKVSLDEYKRSYQNTYRFFQDKMKGDFKDDILKQMVLDRLIEAKIWTVAAQELGVTVTPEELRDDIMRREEFRRNGQFDPDLYRRLLMSIRLTPALYEAEHKMDLLRDKAMTVVRDSVALTPAEITEAQSLIARQAPVEPGAGPTASERILQDFLLQKQERALAAYQEAMKARLPIQVHKEMM
jgi:peptidyl-prolyl cis-trans isomerase D